MVNPVGSRQLADDLTVMMTLDRFRLLVVAQACWAAELPTFGLGTRAAIAGPSDDQLTLQLGEAPEHGQDQATVRVATTRLAH